MEKRKLIAGGLIAVAVAVAAYLLVPRGYCKAAKSKYGLEVPVCPDGRMRQQVAIEGSNLRRTGPGTVQLAVRALYAVGTSDEIRDVPVTSFDATLVLVDGAGAETAIEVETWKRDFRTKVAEITLPPVPDGDYRLRAIVKSRVETTSVELPLPLYAPATIHVVTDRPLYEPGNVVQFRALAVRSNDLSPIDGRAGSWVVRDPTGAVLLEEKAPAGEWGVVAGSFPLDSEAEKGSWTVAWRSGDTEGSRSFQVEPFTLPRFRVEATPDQRFYRPGNEPTLDGAVSYSSGAPVAGAAVEIDWTVSADRWPAPTSWSDGGLPTRATTGADGRFSLTLPAVPDDLIGQARLVARIAATDPAGDRVESGASLLLSEDAIAVQAVTELEGGLVKGYNNRVYLRVTTADGRPLPGAQVNVTRGWESSDQGIDASLDEDSVARVQVDPGEPTMVVIPPPPVRAPPRGTVVTRTELRELVSQQTSPLADQVEMDRWQAGLEPCAKWAGDDSGAQVVVQVSATGAFTALTAGDDPLDRCVASVVRRKRLPAGQPRLYQITWSFDSSHLAEVRASVQSTLTSPDGLEQLMQRAASDARDCVPSGATGAVGWPLAWQVSAGATAVRLSWMKAGGSPVPAPLLRCLSQRTAGMRLAEPADSDGLGLVRFTVSAPAAQARVRKPQPTTMLGYELRVSASVSGEALGSTLLRMGPGQVPPLRLRATPVLAKPGETVAVELLRGDGFVGDLPAKLEVDHLGKVTEIEVAKEKRTASYELPADAAGWYEIRGGGQRARIFVRSAEELTVSVEPAANRYAPGDHATLSIKTTIGGRGAAAAVGLIGVDESLSQLVALPGPDDLGGLRPPIEMSAPAFGVLEAQALALGRIRGANAAEATIMAVSAVPEPADVDTVIFDSATSEIDPESDLVTRFYPLLDELHRQVRAWESSAPAGEQMTPARMAALWSKALDAAEKAGKSIEDAYGRRLRLHRLPHDLLELVDPRQVVVVGTRLPEDVENWIAWVEEKRP